MRGLYVHIPFCVKKCSYCDFVSSPYGSRDKYLDVLEKHARLYRGMEFDTVFVGGGTPTSLTEAQLRRLFGIIKGNFRISEDCEYSVEANPRTLTPKKLALMRECGVNRISMGAQSFNDDELKILGRVHTAAEADETARLIRKSGFDNFNIDIMTALPYQTREKLMRTLERAVSLDPAHISCYSLILEEGTPLERGLREGKFTLPDEDEDREMYHAAQKFLESCGYRQYEISNFAKPGFECRHNINYWKCGEYLGIGAAAHSFMNGERFFANENPREYTAGDVNKYNEEILTPRGLMGEYVMLGMRMNEGISAAEFEQRFGEGIPDEFMRLFDKYERLGFIEKSEGRIYFNDEGRDVSNYILCDFV